MNFAKIIKDFKLNKEQEEVFRSKFISLYVNDSWRAEKEIWTKSLDYLLMKYPQLIQDTDKKTKKSK